MNVMVAERKALVAVPTYNERDNIGTALARLFDGAGDSVHALVIDDGSPDGTAEVVRALMAAAPGTIHLIERSHKQGLGTAYVEAFRWALARDYWAVVEMDADGSHDPAVVPRLLDALGQADLAIGSRYVSGGGVANWGLFRRALSLAGNLYARLWLRFRVKDSTSGFRAFRAEALASQELGSVSSEGYSFQIEMTRRIHRAGGRIVEIPIEFTDRTLGLSKMSRRIALEAFVSVTRWGLRDLFGRPERPS